MITLVEIQAAAMALSSEEQAELLRFLSARIDHPVRNGPKARLVHRDDDSFLEAPLSAPPMTPENVKKILENWP